MKIGLQIIRFNWPGSPANLGVKLAEIGRTADAVGFDSLWVMDHFFQMDAPQGGFTPHDPMLDGYTALSYLAAVTQRARLGTMVTGVIYRQPGHLVKIVSNLDVLSGGRAYLGIGAAWYEREARGLGFPFPSTKERFERLEETLQIVKQVWSGTEEPYTGRHYQLAEPINSPAPLTKPHPPILIGGSGEQKTLRLVAQYADACNLFAAMGNETLGQKLDVLKRHCEAVGRDYNEIERTALGQVYLGPGGMTTVDLIGQCHSLAAAGIQHFIFSLSNDHEITPIETIGREVIPAVAGL
ncbi:MAG: LLM class F420-dependent oxidoreductase [Chloroflexota bacterium]